MRFRPLRLLGAVAVVAATLAPAASALAADPQAGSPDQAVALDKQLSGSLGPGGNFAYYRFHYPGDSSVATINADFIPDDPFILQQVGFNVYAPDGSLVVKGGAQPGSIPDVLANVIDDDPAAVGDYIVQVYNYDPSRPVDFTVWTTGSAQAPTTPASQPAPAPAAPPAPAETAAPAPTEPAAPAPAPSQPEGGSQGVGAETLTGNLAPGGSFAEYEFNYPGDSEVFTLNMTVTPRDPEVLKLAGFEIYGPNGELVVKGGAQPGMTANVSANVISTVAGRYLVKVYNYHPTAAVDYSVQLATSPSTTAAV
jgi:hypothetical protein